METGNRCFRVTDQEAVMTAENAPGPEERAEAAARDLADRGLPVTARAVREVAGVRMTVATSVARAWREAADESEKLTIPEVPADVTARFTAIWADAYRSAVTSVSPERDRLAAEVAELRQEIEALTAEFAQVEEERDVARAAESDATARAEAAEQAVREQQNLAEIAKVSAREVEAERDRLIQQIDNLISRIPEVDK